MPNRLKGKGTGKGSPYLSDDDFIAMFEQHGPAKMEEMGLGKARGIYSRRETLEKELGRQIKAPDPGPMSRTTRLVTKDHPARVTLDVTDGIVLIGSDSHYWPGPPSAAHRAFLKFCKDLNPVLVVKNGDVLDGSSISRHPPIGWEARPSLIQEIETVRERMDEIRQAVPSAKFVWPLGNHDARFETRLATVAPEYARIHGVHLHDHVPGWESCWSCFINDDVVIKHRFKGGIHATHNNALWSGRSIFTGHLHSLQVRPLTDYNGTRWGVDCGTMADPDGPQFIDYTEDNPKNWRSGFIVATFWKGMLLQPEIVRVIDSTHVEFRGSVMEV